MNDDLDCPHDCYLCVVEAKCERSHLATLTVCDACIRRSIGDGSHLTEATHVGAVMKALGGRANPARVIALVREVRR